MRRTCTTAICIMACVLKIYAKANPITIITNKVQMGVAAGTDSLNLDSAKLTVSGLFQSNMVIQRNKPAQLWGTGKPGTTVSVNASWNKKRLKVKVGATGSWLVSIPAAPANASPQTLTISTRHQPVIKMDNILIGEVWVCSGQSNMVMWMGYANIFLQGVINYEAEIARANHPTLRYLDIRENAKNSPVDTINGAIKKWSVCTPAVANQYSALAYYFGWKLDSTLNIPVGLVVSAVGATAIDRWTSRESAQTDSVLIKYYSHFDRLSTLYNGMIYPLRNLAIKGFLWDQGESNEYDSPASHYADISKAMITQWRQIFNQGDLPFYFVQMTPTKFPAGNDYFYALFREAQADVRSLPNTRMAVTMDIDETNNIHYRNKKIAAGRLASLALHTITACLLLPMGHRTNRSPKTVPT
jgi:sialate O-acetylesterase